jgi:heme exporter protein C
MAALFGLVGAVNLPIIHYSVLWWRTLHQGQSISIGGGSSIAPELLWPLPLTLFGFSALFAAVSLMRMRTELATTRVEARLRRSAGE